MNIDTVSGPTDRERLRAENLKQWEEAQSPENIYYAGLALGRQPTKEEAFFHYANNGGAAAFRQQTNQAAD